MRYLGHRWEQLEFEWDRSPPTLAPSELDAVRAFVAEQRARSPLFFDGPLLVCTGATIDEERARFRVARSSYGPYAWARANGLERPGLYAIGTGVLIFERASGSYAFFERGERVQFDRARIGAIGGVATPPEPQDDGDLRAHVLEVSAREIDEELALDARFDRAQLRYVGAYVDERTMKLEVLFRAELDRCALAGEENVAVVRVARGSIASFVRERRARFESSTLAHLQHIASQLDDEC